jgi:hypothetical protein
LDKERDKDERKRAKSKSEERERALKEVAPLATRGAQDSSQRPSHETPRSGRTTGSHRGREERHTDNRSGEGRPRDRQREEKIRDKKQGGRPGAEKTREERLLEAAERSRREEKARHERKMREIQAREDKARAAVARKASRKSKGPHRARSNVEPGQSRQHGLGNSFPTASAVSLAQTDYGPQTAGSGRDEKTMREYQTLAPPSGLSLPLTEMSEKTRTRRGLKSRISKLWGGEKRMGGRPAVIG